MRMSKNKIGPIAVFTSRIDPGKRNLLVLHGALGAARRLLHVAVPFEDDFNVLLCDLRGHGTSDMPPDGYDPATMAHDLLEPIKATFGGSPFAVIAESFSGIIALEIGKLLPQLQCIAMIDTPFDNQRMPDTLTVLKLAFESRPNVRDAIARFGADFFGLDVERGTVTPKRYFTHLEGLRVPILIVTGSRKAVGAPDAGPHGAYFTDQDRSDIEAVYQGAFSVLEVPGAGHRLLKTHVVATIEGIRSFLDQQFPAPGR